MKLMLSIVITSFVFIQQSFTMNKKEAFTTIHHLYHNVLVYNKNAQEINYEELLKKKPYLSDNIYTEKYPEFELIPDDEKNVLFRLFTDKKSQEVLFVCKEDQRSHKRYFIDNQDDNVFYVLDDGNKLAQKYLDDISSHEKYLKRFIIWARDIVSYCQEAGFSVDPGLVSKLENFGA